jgi:hypothetical protein
MAITYTNVTYDNIIDSLHTIISDEFQIPIQYDEHRGSQSFLLEIQDNILDEMLASGQQRNYTILISFNKNKEGQKTKQDVEDVSVVVEKLKRLLFNNRNYSPSGTYKFHDGEVTDVIYDDESTAAVTFNCKVMEIYN